MFGSVKGEQRGSVTDRRLVFNEAHLPDCLIPVSIDKGRFVEVVEKVVGQRQIAHNHEYGVSAGVGAAYIPSVVAKGALHVSVDCLDVLAPLTNGESWAVAIDHLARLATAEGLDFAAEHSI